MNTRKIDATHVAVTKSRYTWNIVSENDSEEYDSEDDSYFTWKVAQLADARNANAEYFDTLDEAKKFVDKHRENEDLDYGLIMKMEDGEDVGKYGEYSEEWEDLGYFYYPYPCEICDKPMKDINSYKSRYAAICDKCRDIVSENDSEEDDSEDDSYFCRYGNW